MKKFILIDSYNLFYRALYAIKESDIELCKGMLLHTLFYMIKKACDKFNPDHMVVCADGKGTWRKSIYPAYKMNRLAKLQEKSPNEIEREQILKDVFDNEFLPFLKNNTNITYLDYENAEADDLIANFIGLHPNDNIIIVSSDNDFVQLITDNVIIYNTMDDRIISKECIVSALNNKPIKFSLKDGKVSISMKDIDIKAGDSLVPMNDWIEYALFMKCIRGDKSDNIFSAYPGVREKSTKKNVGILDAFNDRYNKGYNWQTFMNSTWETPLGEKKLVKECYEFNKKLIDLQEIPCELKNNIRTHILESLHTDYKANVGIYLMKFFTKWNLNKLLEISTSFSGYFSKSYPKE